MFLNTVIVVSKLIRSVQITVLTVLTLEVFRLLINKHIDLLDRNNIHLSNVITRKSLICVNSSFDGSCLAGTGPSGSAIYSHEKNFPGHITFTLCFISFLSYFVRIHIYP